MGSKQPAAQTVGHSQAQPHGPSQRPSVAHAGQGAVKAHAPQASARSPRWGAALGVLAFG
jgi:hypothetical protein